jgi:carboxypeptidase Taq
MTAYEAFTEYVAQLNDLMCALSILTWDARTKMPPRGAQTRAQQQATLSHVLQERFAGDEMGRLLDRAEKEVAGGDPDSYRVRSVCTTRKAYDIFRRIPSRLVQEMAALKAVAEQVWAEARQNDDFPQFAPYLEQIVQLSRELAAAIGYESHPYDAMLLQYEPGMTAGRLIRLFEELKAGILPLLQRIVDRGIPAPSELWTHEYPADRQRAFVLEIIRAFGYDLERGRLDETVHPFEISFTREDVRINTRYHPHYLPAALFGTFHESGHGLYEQGVDPALTRTALACDFLGLYAVGGVSYGAHESQSRLWENLVGRSRIFWRLHFPRLQEYFPSQLADVDWETFYRAVNRVQPSLIRVEADEVTYNLHIMLRTEIEMGLMDGSLAVDQLPDVWNARMEEYLGMRPPTDRQGVLQDVHWSSGYVGSFPAYTIGNVMSVQFFQAARQQVAGLDDALAAGEYQPLLSWLTDHVYRHGRAFSAEELLQKSTGSGLSSAPYLAYIEKKYTELYPA